MDPRTNIQRTPNQRSPENLIGTSPTKKQERISMLIALTTRINDMHRETKSRQRKAIKKGKSNQTSQQREKMLRRNEFHEQHIR